MVMCLINVRGGWIGFFSVVTTENRKEVLFRIFLILNFF